MKRFSISYYCIGRYYACFLHDQLQQLQSYLPDVHPASAHVSAPSPALAASNAATPEKLALNRIEFKNIEGWETDNHVEAFTAFLKSCGEFVTRADTDATGKDELLAPVSVWKDICRKAVSVPAGDELSVRQFFEQEFVAAKASSNTHPHAFLTGYYEPLLTGARTKQRSFVYPVYGMPQPPTSFAREQIDIGQLEGHAPVIAYVDDPIQLFFMHIQGSGSIKLPGGEIIRVGYAGNNSQPYVAIGRAMVDKGLINAKGVTLQSIRQWLYDHPKDMWQTMWQNPSYIFFQEMNGGPYGTEKVALTSGRSLAVDDSYIPLGMPVFIDTVVPGTPDKPFVITRKLMIAQDTGRGIRGPMRGDIFFGSGHIAEDIAGRMKAGGDFILLVPKAIGNTFLSDWIGSLFHNDWLQSLPDYKSLFDGKAQ